MKQQIMKVCLIAASICGLVSQNTQLEGSLIYETYLESWDSGWNSAMTGLPPTPSTSPTTYDDVTLDIAFASYTFPGLNGVQFSDPTGDTNDVINYVHSQNGKAKISYGGASYAGPNYFISQTAGWPDNISSLVAGVSSVVTSYGFDGVDFDIEDPLKACVEVLCTHKEQEALFHVYDSLFTKILNEIKALPQLNAAFLIQIIESQQKKKYFLGIERELFLSLDPYKIALEENPSTAVSRLKSEFSQWNYVLQSKKIIQF